MKITKRQFNVLGSPGRDVGAVGGDEVRSRGRCRGLVRKNTALSTSVNQKMTVQAMIVEVEQR